MPTESILQGKDLPEAADIASAGRWKEVSPAVEPERTHRRSLFDVLDTLEIGMVCRASRWTRLRPVRHTTIAVNLLGNGWIYPLIAAGLLLSGLANAWTIAAAAVLAAGGAHAIYAIVKRTARRVRPFEREPLLQPLGRVLDRYSFPSGHCMTLTAVLAPIVHACPALFPAAAAALAVLSWCRLAAAHHYPSDVLAGIAIGAIVALPLANLLVPA